MLSVVQEQYGYAAYNIYKSSLDHGDVRGEAKATYGSEIAKDGVTREQTLIVVQEQHGDAAYKMYKLSLDHGDMHHETAFEARFQLIKVCHEKHGHCDVPRKKWSSGRMCKRNSEEFQKGLPIR